MRFLAFGDIIENREALKKFSSLNFSGYNFVVFTGDILTLLAFKKLREEKVLKGKIPKDERERRLELKKAAEPKEILQKEARKLKGFVKYFKKINNKLPLYGVFGNADHRWIVNQTNISDYILDLHLRPINRGEYALIGYEGRPKYVFETYDNPTERAFDEGRAFEELSKALKGLGGKVILITHAPPYMILDQVEEKYRKYAVGTYGKRAKEGNIGSIAFKKITEKFKPTLHIFGHIHECKGVEKKEKSTFINTGSFGGEREFVEIEILDHEPHVKFVKL